LAAVEPAAQMFPSITEDLAAVEPAVY